MKPRRAALRPSALPTMKDIARLVGVHQSTVSLALRNNPEIPAATRQRIRAVAQQIGYHPDPVLDAFNLHRLSTHPLRSAPAIAFINDRAPGASSAESAARKEAYFGAKQTAERLGFVLDRFFVGPGGVSAGRLNRILEARNIDCAIVASFSPETAELPLNWSGLSGLKIESFHVRPGFDIIAPDHLQSSRTAVARLHKLGYHRPGLVLTRDEDARLLQLSRSGYLVEMAGRSAEPIPEVLYLDAANAAARPALARWVSAERIDAVISGSDEVMELLPQAGLVIPRDVAFASLDRSGRPEEVAGIDAHHYLVGQAAVELIAMRRRINQRGTADETSVTFIPVAWHDGATAPPVAPRRD